MSRRDRTCREIDALDEVVSNEPLSHLRHPLPLPASKEPSSALVTPSPRLTGLACTARMPMPQQGRRGARESLLPRDRDAVLVGEESLGPDGQQVLVVDLTERSCRLLQPPMKQLFAVGHRPRLAPGLVDQIEPEDGRIVLVHPVRVLVPAVQDAVDVLRVLEVR